jgi:hypothetical protein
MGESDSADWLANKGARIMPKRRYRLRRGERKRVAVSWSTFSSPYLTVRLDGNVIGTVRTEQELEMGQEFPFEGGSVLRVQLVHHFLSTQIHVLRNGQPLPGSPSDPFRILKTTYRLIFFVGGLSIVLGILLATVPDSGLQTWGISLIVSGLIFAFLGFLVVRRSTIALGLAIALYTLDALVLLVPGNLLTIILYAVVLIKMIQGFPAMHEIRNRAGRDYQKPVESKQAAHNR